MMVHYYLSKQPFLYYSLEILLEKLGTHPLASKEKFKLELWK